MTVTSEHEGRVTIVTINRPEVRNAVDRATAQALADAFRAFDADDDRDVAVLTGAGGTFCAGADLKGVSEHRGNALRPDGDGPMGPTRMLLSKPVIAAVEGYAVAGGLEPALWCDLRVAARDAVFGVFCRRWGVPLVDGGTIRLPRLIGHSHALDLILTGRGVEGDEALRMGLANRLVESGTARRCAVALAAELAALPQRCLRADRASSYDQWGHPIADALRIEYEHGVGVLESGEPLTGATRSRRVPDVTVMQHRSSTHDPRYRARGRNISDVLNADRPGGGSQGPPLTGRRVRLHAVLPSDYEYVYALTTHELVGWRWRYRGATPNLETFAQALYHNTLVNFVIERRDSPQRIGFAQAFDASERNGWCHIGLTLDPALSRMGWALESGVLFVNYLFTLWNFRKLYATVVEFNAPEFQSALQRGFELEGRLVEHEYHNGRYWDMLLYSYTREAWEKTGPALVAKLAEPPSIG